MASDAKRRTFVAFDVETTGLHPWKNDIIEVAGIKFDSEGQKIDSFQRFSDPGYPVPRAATAVNGITTDMIAGSAKPLFVVEEFLHWCGSNSIFFAHNASFDRRFIQACYEKEEVLCPELLLVDTLQWARRQRLRVANFQLGTLLQHIGANTTGLHRALADAVGVAELVAFLSRKSGGMEKAVSYELKKHTENRQRRDGSASDRGVAGAGQARTCTHEEMKQQAKKLTEEAATELEQAAKILDACLSSHDTPSWDSFKEFSNFPEPKPPIPIFPAAPSALELPHKPQRSDPKFAPQLGVIAHMSKALRERKEQEAKARFMEAHRRWEELARSQYEAYKTLVSEYRSAIERTKAEYARTLAAWEQRRRSFLAAQKKANAQIDALIERCKAGDPSAILRFFERVLGASAYPSWLKRSLRLDYVTTSRMLLIEYDLPSYDALPKVQEVKFLPRKQTLQEKSVGQANARKLYDSVLYQITLRTIHEAFEADQIGTLHHVAFNGYVSFLDSAVGQQKRPCILSIKAEREAFRQINLHKIDPKACFEGLGGVGSRPLHKLKPVAPVETPSNDDFTVEF